MTKHGLWKQTDDLGSNPYSARVTDTDYGVSLVKMLNHSEPLFPHS